MRVASEKAREKEICFKVRSHKLPQLQNESSTALIHITRLCANMSHNIKMADLFKEKCTNVRGNKVPKSITWHSCDLYFNTLYLVAFKYPFSHAGGIKGV
jgi:hypothetical protein